MLFLHCQLPTQSGLQTPSTPMQATYGNAATLSPIHVRSQSPFAMNGQSVFDCPCIDPFARGCLESPLAWLFAPEEMSQKKEDSDIL